MDLSRQLRIPMASVSVDADKCYNRINHIVMSLLLRAITGNPETIAAMLTPIQHMKFYQHTGRGDSNTFMGRCPKDSSLQGLCQGNGCAPACWLMLSLLLIRCHQKEGHGLVVTSPISGELNEFMGEIYADDTDLLTFLFNMPNLETIMELTQRNLDKWARLLNARGGALNPDKCYWYLIYYECQKGFGSMATRGTICSPSHLQTTPGPKSHSCTSRRQGKCWESGLTLLALTRSTYKK